MVKRQKITRDESKNHILVFVMEKWNDHKFEVYFCFIAAFAAYMFAFTNKIPNWDDTQYLFAKGASLSSGRWGLDILQLILPNYSIPWFWGCMSIILLTIAICVILDIFQIKNRIIRIVLAVVIITFPSEAGTMLYMFTSTSYAIAFLCSVVSVRIMDVGHKKFKIIAIVLTVFSLSIYQAYIAITASFFILKLIQLVMFDTNINHTIRKGLDFLLFLIGCLCIYCLITFAILQFSGTALNGWAVQATSASGGVMHRAIRSWKLFVAMIVFRDYGLITSNISWIVHLFCLGYAVLCLCLRVLKRKHLGNSVLIFALISILLPMSVNAITLLVGENGVHALTLYSFITLYLLVGIICEYVYQNGAVKQLTLCGMVIIALSNIYAANKAYFKQYMVYENTFSFYNSLITQIQMTPGFDEDSVIAIIGNVEQDSRYLDNFGEVPIYGLNGFKGYVISDDFISQYIGIDLNYANELEIKHIQKLRQFEQMPAYPYYGYIQQIDQYIVVKLGN